VFSNLGGFSPPMPMTLVEGTAQERFFGQLVTQGYFEALGLTPAKGRFFLPGEVSSPGYAPVAVLSYGAWKSRFNSAGDVIGKTLEINGAPFTVVGVAPQGFLGVSAVFGPDVWLPATMAQQVLPPELQDVLQQRGKPFFQGSRASSPESARPGGCQFRNAGRCIEARISGCECRAHDFCAARDYRTVLEHRRRARRW
jgi:hypothetical protein